jgi:hypothetical protein
MSLIKIPLYFLQAMVHAFSLEGMSHSPFGVKKFLVNPVLSCVLCTECDLLLFVALVPTAVAVVQPPGL